MPKSTLTRCLFIALTEIINYIGFKELKFISVYYPNDEKHL